MSFDEPETAPAPRRPEPASPRGPALAVLGGAAAAAISVPAAAAEGGPYLTLTALNPWIVVFALGGFVALFAAAFLINRTLAAGIEDAARRWERSLLIWGAIALVIGALALLFMLAAGPPGSSLVGALSLVALVESALVVGTVLTSMLAG